MLRSLVLLRSGKRGLFIIWIAALAMLVSIGLAGQALAQSEPTVKQIYEAAQAGKVDQAQVMVQQVLIAHPDSARAHFVQAELFARRGLRSQARESLLQAEKLSPGLPFARPQAVQELRDQLASKANPASSLQSATVGKAATPARPESSFPLGLGLALGGGAIALAIFAISRRASRNRAEPAPYAVGPDNAGSSAQTFGSAVSGQPGNVQQAYGQSYGAPYGQPPVAPGGSGIGRQVMGGLATGAAVGAGMLAAQALGRNMMGHDERGGRVSDDAPPIDKHGDQTPLPGNSDMGGQQFGLNESASWDDAGGGTDDSGGGGGGDWDT